MYNAVSECDATPPRWRRRGRGSARDGAVAAMARRETSAPRAPEIVVAAGDGTVNPPAERGFTFAQFLVFLRDEVAAATDEAFS